MEDNKTYNVHPIYVAEAKESLDHLTNIEMRKPTRLISASIVLVGALLLGATVATILIMSLFLLYTNYIESRAKSGELFIAAVLQECDNLKSKEGNNE